MKIIKFDEEYYLLEQAAASAGDYLYNNDAIIKIVRTTEVKKGWLVMATTDINIDDLPQMDVAQIEKPPTTYQPTDMIAYSNWVLNWCSNNKYRKVVGGVNPFGTGESYTDEELFQKYLDSLITTKTEWLDVEVEMVGEIVNIIKL